jgi:hypothetical protein
LNNGQVVVIKVQHAEVAERLLQDLRNLETIGDTLKRFDPDFDFSPVIREWASEIPKELGDFITPKLLLIELIIISITISVYITSNRHYCSRFYHSI